MYVILESFLSSWIIFFLVFDRRWQHWQLATLLLYIPQEQQQTSKNCILEEIVATCLKTNFNITITLSLSNQLGAKRLNVLILEMRNWKSQVIPGKPSNIIQACSRCWSPIYHIKGPFQILTINHAVWPRAVQYSDRVARLTIEKVFNLIKIRLLP